MILYIFLFSFIIEIIFGYYPGLILRYSVLVGLFINTFLFNHFRINKIVLFVFIHVVLFFCYHLAVDKNISHLDIPLKLRILGQTVLIVSFVILGKYIKIWSKENFLLLLGLLFFIEIAFFGNYRGLDNRFFVGDINPIIAVKNISLIGLSLLTIGGSMKYRFIGFLFLAIGIVLFGSRANFISILCVFLLFTPQLRLRYRLLFVSLVAGAFLMTERFLTFEDIFQLSYARIDFWSMNYQAFFSITGTNIFANDQLEYPHNWILELIMLGGLPILISWFYMVYKAMKKGSKITRILISYLVIFGMFSTSIWTSYEFWLIVGHAFSEGE